MIRSGRIDARVLADPLVTDPFLCRGEVFEDLRIGLRADLHQVAQRRIRAQSDQKRFEFLPLHLPKFSGVHSDPVLLHHRSDDHVIVFDQIVAGV